MNRNTDQKEDKKLKKIEDETTWEESPWLVIKGFLMGSADIVPGVSGGTMALITGIYDRVIYAVKSFDKKVVTSLVRLNLKDVFNHFHWKFFIVLFTGIFGAVLFFTKVIPLQVYMHSDPEVVYGLFFGLILGSVFILLKEVAIKDRTWKNMLGIVAGAIVGFWVVIQVPTDTPETFWFVFLSGMIAFCAMILPGISGSYILLILGKYDYVLSQFALLGGFDTVEAVWALVPLGLGGVLGLVLFSRLLSWLLQYYHAITIMVLIGFLVGSLYMIWPYQDRTFETHVRSVEIIELNDPVVRDLIENPPDTLKPSYLELGERSMQNDTEMVEVKEVSRKLVNSSPFVPMLTEAEREDVNLWGGVIGILIGLVMVAGIDYLREKS